MLKLQIVDDADIISEMLAGKINWPSLGFVVTGAAEDGEKALRLLERDVPDVLVTEIGVPVLDGIELIRRTKERHPHMKFVIMTGLSEFKYALEAIKLGVSDYVLKPFEPDELSGIVRRLACVITEERRKRREAEKASELLLPGLPHTVSEAASLADFVGSERNKKIVENIVGYIEKNIASPSLNLQSVASQVHLSEKYMSSLFKEAMGMTINAYMIMKKMELAGRLLQDPSVKIYEVYGKTGYADQNYFRESFKRYYGLTPSGFRSRYL